MSITPLPSTPPTRQPSTSQPSASQPSTSQPSAPENRVVELNIVPWPDVVIDRHGYDPRSPYVERFWVSVLGPSAIWLHRLIARQLAEEPDGFALDLAETAGRLGLGWNGGRNSPLMRTFLRCCDFKTARSHDRETIAFRTRLAPLTQRQLVRLPEAQRREHDQWISTERHAPQDGSVLDPRQLASTLIGQGAGLHETSEWLSQWNVPAAAARSATAWAWARAHCHPSAQEPAGSPQPPAPVRSTPINRPK